MLKKIIACSSILLCTHSYAAHLIHIHQAPLENLKKYIPLSEQNTRLRLLTVDKTQTDSLVQVNQTRDPNKVVSRYQQLYKGIPIIGAQVMISQKLDEQVKGSKRFEVDGDLVDSLDVDINPAFNEQEALRKAKIYYFGANSSIPNTKKDKAGIQIRLNEEGAPLLVYEVSFKLKDDQGKPSVPVLIINAHTGELINQWNHIKYYQDVGPGGNEKVHEYWYGKDGLPPLEVKQKGSQCIMESPQVKLVHLANTWDYANLLSNAYQYTCNQNTEEPINGAFSPLNDAYYFGHSIVSMYKEWYGLNVLQSPNGDPMQLIMRIHFGKGYDNAFWDGQSVSFGDGLDFYPLVALDIAGHEITHGFTEQHANLEYHDQSGAINESLSDMAGIAAKAYMLETNPLLYKKAYNQEGEIHFSIGETVVRDSFGKALRFMDYPSSDGSSADCYDKTIAQSYGSYCALSYDDVLHFAQSQIGNPGEQENFIVHTASGIYNKAFYSLSKQIGIKEAFHIMLIANIKYWTPTTDFRTGACGVYLAAKDLNLDLASVESAFGQAGISINSTCSDSGPLFPERT